MRTGDIILAAENSLIVRFMRFWQKDEVRWGHVAIAENEFSIIEAHNHVRRIEFAKWQKKYKTYKIIRMKSLKADERHEILTNIRTLLGQRYGVWRIVLQIFDHITGTNWFTKQNRDKRVQVCSSLIAWGFQTVINFRFNGVYWSSCEPDDIDDEFERNPDFMLVEGR